MSQPAYPAARIVAPKIFAHFAMHEQKARERGRAVVAPPPDEATIEALIDAAFWASLRREESYIPKISLAFVDAGRGDAPDAVRPPAAARYPPRWSRWRRPSNGPASTWACALAKDGLSVWGTVRAIPFLCFVVEVAAPGLLVVKHHRGDETGKFVNVAVIEGDQIKIVDEAASSLPDCPPLLTSLLGFDSPASWTVGLDAVNVLVQLAVSMRAHGRGGLLLVVPPAATQWQESIVRPIPYAVSPAVRGARAAHARGRGREGGAAVAGSAAPRGGSDRRTDGGRRRDGLDERSTSSLAFGAKIARRKGSPQVEQVAVTEPIEGNVADHRAPDAAWRHAASVGGAVRPRSARRGRARRVAGRPVHRVRVVAVRGDGARAPGRDAAAVDHDGQRRTR